MRRGRTRTGVQNQTKMWGKTPPKWKPKLVENNHAHGMSTCGTEANGMESARMLVFVYILFTFQTVVALTSTAAAAKDNQEHKWLMMMLVMMIISMMIMMPMSKMKVIIITKQRLASFMPSKPEDERRRGDRIIRLQDVPGTAKVSGLRFQPLPTPLQALHLHWSYSSLFSKSMQELLLADSKTRF